MSFVNEKFVLGWFADGLTAYSSTQGVNEQSEEANLGPPMRSRSWFHNCSAPFGCYLFGCCLAVNGTKIRRQRKTNHLSVQTDQRRKREATSSHSSALALSWFCCPTVDRIAYTKSTSKIQRNLQISNMSTALNVGPLLPILNNCSFDYVGSYHMLDGVTGKRSLEKHPSASLCSLGNTAYAVAIVQAVTSALVESWMVISDKSFGITVHVSN